MEQDLDWFHDPHETSPNELNRFIFERRSQQSERKVRIMVIQHGMWDNNLFFGEIITMILSHGYADAVVTFSALTHAPFAICEANTGGIIKNGEWLAGVIQKGLPICLNW